MTSELERRIHESLTKKGITLPWSDLFLLRDRSGSSFLQTSFSAQKVNFSDLDASLTHWIWEHLIPKLNEQFEPLIREDKHDARFTMDGLSFRASGRDTIEGRVYVLRRFPVAPESLNHIGITPRLVQAMFGKDAPKSGLVLFVGRTGSGKTTVASAFTKEWITRFGGVSWSVENPIEIDIHGHQGAGHCFQYEVSSDDDFGHAIHDTMRNLPRLIYVGEIRNGIHTAYSPGARAAVHAATTGHLVVSTMHAGDIQIAIASLIGMVGTDDAAMRISMALRAVFALELTLGDDQKPKLNIEPLIIVPDSRADNIRSFIREQNLHQLSSVIVQQRKLYE